MGVFTFESEIASAVAAATLYKALVFDADTILPKVREAIKSVEIIEGNGESGTIKKLTFVEDGKIHYVKHKVDVVDNDDFMYNYTIIESDVLPDYYEKISYETKLIVAPNGGSIVKAKMKYFTKGDAQLEEEDINHGKEEGEGLFKAVEAYLLANPNY